MMWIVTSAEQLLDESRLTPLHRRIWLVAALGLLLDGFDFFVIGVCLPLVTVDLGLGSVQVGLLASAAVVGSVVGALVVGPVADRIGRRLVFRLDLIAFVVAALASSLAWDIWSLIAFRFLLGVAIGADYPLSSSYAVEVAPRRHRERLLVGVIAFQAVGSLLGVALGLAAIRLHPEPGAWRWVLGSGALLALAVVVARHGLPESPRWLLSQGRREEAAQVVGRLVGRPVAPEQVTSAADERVPWRRLFGTGLRRRTVFTSVPWLLLDVVVYGTGVFTPTILAGLVVGDTGGSYVAGVVTTLRETAFTDVFLVIGFVAALLLVGRVGAVRLQVVGFVAVAAGLAVLALSAALPGGADAWYGLAFLGFAMANFFQNAGPNSTTFLMPAVAFPTSVRATGAGLGAAAGKAGAVLVTLGFPLLHERLGLTASIGLMAAGALVAAVVTVAFRPEHLHADDPAATH
jgi:MFS family permease